MESVEIKKELNMTYDDLVRYLLQKYGHSKYDYFCNESCKSKNHKVNFSPSGLQGLNGKANYVIMPEHIVGYVDKINKKIIFNPRYIEQSSNLTLNDLKNQIGGEPEV